ncbi:MAG: YceI family protein [Phycisphaerae bacterium]
MRVSDRVIACCAAAGWMSLLAPAALAADNYKADAVHSAVIFRIKHLNVSYSYGRFNDVAGSFSFDDAKPENSALEFTVKTASIDTHDKKRDDHLRSAEFFDAEKHPAITFKSKAVKKLGESEFEVAGDLTLRGVTKPLTVKVERTGAGPDPWGGQRSGFETTFTIKRGDFEMNALKGGLGDDVRLIVSIEGVKQ